MDFEMRGLAYTEGSGSQRLLFEVHLDSWVRLDFYKTSMRVREPRGKIYRYNEAVTRSEAVNQLEMCL
jgi:hypothetical protein